MIFVKVLFALAAATIVFVEQLRSEKKYRRLLLLLAGIIMLSSAIFTWIDHYEGEKAELERAADLAVLQKLTSSLNDLGFELLLVDPEPEILTETAFQIEIVVNTMHSTTGRFADYLVLAHDGDSGWSVASATFKRYKTLPLTLDSSSHTLSFVLKDFGVACAPENSRPCWQPDNVADLGRVSLMLSAFTRNSDIYYRDYYAEWCPVEKVRIYVNAFEDDNLLFEASRVPKSAEAQGEPFHHFFPEWHPEYHEPKDWRFRIEPLQLRRAWLASRRDGTD